jgi:hypothetical protein
MDRFLVQRMSVSSSAIQTELTATAAASAKRKKQAKDDLGSQQNGHH